MESSSDYNYITQEMLDYKPSDSDERITIGGETQRLIFQ
jgi:hypothetical protein